MKIKIKREGGFIGTTSKANLDFDELTVAEQNAFNALAEQSLQTEKKTKEDIASKLQLSTANESENLKSETKTRGLESIEEPKSQDVGLELAGNEMPHNTQTGMMRDAFSYSISMKKDGKTVSLKFDDMTAPPEIVEIFQKYVQY